jgi:hypothetical protein
VLAFVLTLVVALYILGPDLFSRWLVGLFAPARVQTRSRSEEISKALFGSLIPFVFSYVILFLFFHRLRDFGVLKAFFNGVYSQQSFDRNSEAFFHSVKPVLMANARLAGLIYSFELVWAFLLIALIRYCGRIIRNFEKHERLRSLVIYLVRPWTAAWHMKLSGILLERKSQFIQVDVMTKLDILYRGKLVGYDLAADGSLVSLTLENAKKFKREELLAARNKAPSKKINTASFWTPIEGRIFMLMSHEVVSLNLNYIDPTALQQTIAASIPKVTANQVLDSIRAKRKARSFEGKERSR